MKNDRQVFVLRTGIEPWTLTSLDKKLDPLSHCVTMNGNGAYQWIGNFCKKKPLNAYDVNQSEVSGD